MRSIIFITLISIFSFGIFSCRPTEKKANAIGDTDVLYEKYKSMVTEGDGCVACIDCASLALAITYNTEDGVADSKKKLLEYYKENGSIPCPELLPELKQELALVSESK